MDENHSNKVFIVLYWLCLITKKDESNLSHSSNWVITVINASVAVTLLEQRPEKIFRLWAGFEPMTSAMPVQCSPNWTIKATWGRSHVALIAQLGEHCTSIAEVVGSNPAQSLKIFSGLCSSSVTAALALMAIITKKEFINYKFYKSVVL